MKRKQSKIKLFLLVALVSILGLLVILYAVFCRGGEYNKVNININQVENSTVPQETPTEENPASEETPTEENSEENPEEKPATSWEKYEPDEVLKGENWHLALISKKYPLDRNYLPATSIILESSKVTVDSRVAEAYKKMYDTAKADGVTLTPYSGYCSYQTQKTMYNNKLQSFLTGMSEEEAKINTEKRIEPAGCSENGAGLAVDIGSASAGFASTQEFKWLTLNAHHYGFILRYPEGKKEETGENPRTYTYRYVGIPHAIYINEQQICLEEYIEKVKGHTNEEPLEITADGQKYNVYYVPAAENGGTEIPVPTVKPYTVSGCNAGGFIVTVAVE